MTQNNPPADLPDAGTAPPSHAADSVDTLKQAMRRARSDDAERTGARAELRATRLWRLEMLQDALEPLLAQIPADVDIFDIALVPTSDPRLFIDMIGFVAMGRDTRHYILQQDTRHGRIVLAETESLGTMVDAVTDYVARRLLERDKALAADARAHSGAVARAARSPGSPVWSPDDARRREMAQSPKTPAPRRVAAPVRWMAIAFSFVIDLLGAVAFFSIVGALGWYLWMRTHPPV